MIQLKAAQRLMAARANEGQARKYLESLGVKVGKMADEDDTMISFAVEEPQQAAAAIAQKLGKRPQIQKVPGGKRWIFELSSSRRVSVFWGRHVKRVALVDTGR